MLSFQFQFGLVGVEVDVEAEQGEVVVAAEIVERTGILPGKIKLTH